MDEIKKNKMKQLMVIPKDKQASFCQPLYSPDLVLSSQN